MKKFKKLAASMLALVMALGMVAPAMAAEGGKYASNDPSAVTLKTESDGHTFKVYQLFEAAPADAISLKENTIKWSSTVNAQTLIDALQKAYPDIFDSVISENAKSDATAQNVAKVLKENFQTPGSQFNTIEQNAALAQTIATSGAFSDSVEVKKGTNQNVQTGYCVMIDQPNTGDPIYMLQTITAKAEAGSTETPVVPITPKDSASQLTKEVWDPAKGDEGGWSDGAIYEAGDVIDFKLTATMPADIKSGKYSNVAGDGKPSYFILLHDIQSEYLTLDPSSIQVQVINGSNTQTLNADRYTVNRNEDGSALGDGCTFEIKIDNVQMLEQAAAGALIQVTYKATLSEDAPTGEGGITNEVKATTSEGEIPGEKVEVFRLELIVNKVDGDNKPLNGAEFTLFEVDDEGNKTGTGIKLTYETIYVNNDGDVWTPTQDDLDADGNVITDNIPEGYNPTSGPKFCLKDLKPGTYILEETKVPDGYNKAADVKIVIKASADETTDNPEPGTLVIEINQDSKFTLEDGVISGTIANNKGLQLPETGGIGTTIFYILGGALAVGAVVLLITKRRVGSSDDE